MGTTDNQGSQTLMAVSRFLNATEDAIKKALSDLIRLMAFHEKTSDFRSLQKIYEKMGSEGLEAYQIRDDIRQELVGRCKAANIPLIDVTMKGDTDVVLVAEADVEKVNALARDILRERGMNVVCMNMDDFLGTIGNVNNVNIIEIKDLSEEEYLSLINATNGISKDFPIGIKKQDNDKFTIAIREDKLRSASDKSFAKAWLQSNLELNSDPVLAEHRKDVLLGKKDFAEKIASEFVPRKRMDETDIEHQSKFKYVVGKEDNSLFIKITDKGAFLCEGIYDKTTNKITTNTLEAIPVNSPDYAATMQYFCEKLNGECVINSPSEFISHMAGNTQYPELDQIMELKAKHMQCMHVVNELDSMIKEKLSKDPQLNDKTAKNSSLYFDAYTKLATQCIEEIASGKTLTAFIDMPDKVSDFFSHLESNFDPKDFVNCLNKMEKFSYIKNSAAQYINTHHMQPEKDDPSRENERDHQADR